MEQKQHSNIILKVFQKSLTCVFSGARSLQSSRVLSSFSTISSELAEVRAEPGGRGPVSPRCFLVM